jgi:hypothetical protein
VQVCVETSHESSVQGLLSLQFRPDVPAHVPAVQTSPVEHGFLSSQVVPSVALAWVQPVLPLHESFVQGLLSSQLIALPGTHFPAVQVSFCVHTDPSLQAVPSVAAGCWHPPAALQLSAVHGSPSSQFGAVPGRQVPD